MNDEILHADLNNCKNIPEGNHLKNLIIKIAKFGKLNFIEDEFILHNFQPHGCSFILLLRESHFAVHTFPEDKRVLIDIATCGDQKLINLKEELITQFQSKLPKIKIQRRSDFLKGA